MLHSSFPLAVLHMDKEDIHKHSGILLSHKRNEFGAFIEMWMDLESVIQSEVSQKEKKQISYINAYV